MSASLRSSARSAVVAELQSRHATEVRSYVHELWDGDDTHTAKSLSAFWREWMPPPGSADEIPREYVFAGARRHVVAEQRSAGISVAESDLDLGDAKAPSDASARIAARFRRLTAKQQEMVRLHLRHRFDLDEMAEITELPVSSATQLLHTALSRLNGSSHEDARILQLALAGATGERLAAESPDTRNRVADLRTTIEVTRQVVARGHEALTPPKKRRSRRVMVLTAVGTALACVVAGFFLLRDPSPEDRAAAPDLDTTGSSRVALRRTEEENAAPSSHAGRSAVAADDVRSVAANHSREADRAPSAKFASSDASPANPTTGQKPSSTAEASAASTDKPATASTGTSSSELARHRGIPTGEAGQAEPLAQPRGAADAAKISAPLAQPLGRSEAPQPAPRIPSAPDAQRETPYYGVSPVSGTASPTPASDATGSLARGSEPDALVDPAPRDSRLGNKTSSIGSTAADRLDTAPIAALRKALGAARWPERREVNVAALLNSVPPSARPPRANGGAFTAQIESSESPWHPERRIVRVALHAREHVPTPRAAATVILLLDVSGSMEAPNRLPLVQAAVAGLLRRLQPGDRVGVVTYAGESRVLLPPAPLTDERAVREAVDGLAAKGRTNGGAGLREAFRLAVSDARATGERIVLLCTDGDFNMGETSEAELGALIDRQRGNGVRLAIFGFGRADRIDARLEALAARARGGSGYVNTRAEAEQALVAQLDTLFTPVAERLEATVEFDPTRVARFRAVGDDEMRPAAVGTEVTFAARDRVLPGETLSALFEVEPVEDATSSGADVRVRLACWESAAGGGRNPQRGFWPGSLTAGAFAEASVDLRFAAATAAFAEALQAGAEEGAPRLDEIERWARGAVGEDIGGYRAELLALIEQARRATAIR